MRTVRCALAFLIGLVVLTPAAPALAQTQLPESKSAPAVGQKAPDFTLPDADGKAVTLSDILTGKDKKSGQQGTANGVLLIFYRGYW